MMTRLVSSAAISTACPSPTGISCSVFTAKTSPRMMALGIDRSMPAVAMTNVVPTLTTVRMATFWASSTSDAVGQAPSVRPQYHRVPGAMPLS
jgi:hypothetical protein